MNGEKLARRATRGAFGARALAAHRVHRILMRFSLRVELLAPHHARLLAPSGAAAEGRRLRRLFHFSQHASLSPLCGRPCAASARLQRCCGLKSCCGLRLLAARPPHRRLRRLSARPSAALRCCRIRLHWHATTPRPRAYPQRTRASNEALKSF